MIVLVGFFSCNYSFAAEYTLEKLWFCSGGTAGDDAKIDELQYKLSDMIGGAIFYAGEGNDGLYIMNYGQYDIEIFTDNDAEKGIPEYWCDYYKLDKQKQDIASEDTDGDGISNRSEYLAGTDPTSIDSRFAVSGIEVPVAGAVAGAGALSDASITVKWLSSEYRTYYLYYSDDAFSDDMPWSLAQHVTGTGGVMSWQDDGTYTGTAPLADDISKRYYKITPSTDLVSSTTTTPQPGDSVADTSWYVAEGYTGGGFDEWITIMNPTGEEASVKIKYMKDDGSVIEQELKIAAGSRCTVHADSVINDGSFSTKVESDKDVIMERTMYWNAGGLHWAGGHNTTGSADPGLTWYFAEGYTGNGFEEWILIMNPGTVPAVCKVSFMKEDGSVTSKKVNVGVTSRFTIDVKEEVPEGVPVAVKVESINLVPVIAERAMYWSKGGIDKIGGHCNKGIKETATTLYFAEGYTGGDFEEYLTLMNPQSVSVPIRVTFMEDNGKTTERDYTLAGTSRLTIRVDDILPNSKVAAKIESLNGAGFIGERVMYWKAGGIAMAGGHCNSGVTNTADLWYFAEGATLGNFSLWLTLMNPEEKESKVKVTYLKEDGSNLEQEITVPGLSRYTINVNEAVPEASVATVLTVINGVNIIAERAMYWSADAKDLSAGNSQLKADSNGQIRWIGGHCSSGVN